MPNRETVDDWMRLIAGVVEEVPLLRDHPYPCSKAPECEICAAKAVLERWRAGCFDDAA